MQNPEEAIATATAGDSSSKKKSDSKKSATTKVAEPDMAPIMSAILKDCSSPAHFIELYYWSQEPQLVNLARTIAKIPEQARSTLQFFLSHLDEDSRLTMLHTGQGKSVQILLRTAAKHEPSIAGPTN